MKNIASVHRFGDKVGIYVGDGSTTYFTAKQARALARSLNAAARSVVKERFVDSNFNCQEIQKVSEEQAEKEVSKFPRNKEQPK